jgi:hypothetical protein
MGLSFQATMVEPIELVVNSIGIKKLSTDRAGVINVIK